MSNLAMLDGVAISIDNDQRTFLDRMNTKQLVKRNNFDDRPAHIDKLFVDEDQFLEDE